MRLGKCLLGHILGDLAIGYAKEKGRVESSRTMVLKAASSEGSTLECSTLDGSHRGLK